MPTISCQYGHREEGIFEERGSVINVKMVAGVQWWIIWWRAFLQVFAKLNANERIHLNWHVHVRKVPLHFLWQFCSHFCPKPLECSLNWVSNLNQTNVVGFISRSALCLPFVFFSETPDSREASYFTPHRVLLLLDIAQLRLALFWLKKKSLIRFVSFHLSRFAHAWLPKQPKQQHRWLEKVVQETARQYWRSLLDVAENKLLNVGWLI